MHAIIETGGKQYKVAEGDTLFIEKLPQEAGETVTFDSSGNSGRRQHHHWYSCGGRRQGGCLHCEERQGQEDQDFQV